MSGFGAKMGNVDDCRGIVGQHPKARAVRKRFQPLARFQYGQGAQQPRGIQCLLGIIHEVGIILLLHPVHKVVTAGARLGRDRALLMA